MKSFILLICVMGISTGCALNRDVLYIEDRLYKLERAQREQQQSTMASQDTEQGLREKIAEMRITVNQVREGLNAIGGRFEEVNYFIKNQQTSEDTVLSELKKTQDMLDDLSDRIVRLEQYMGFEPSHGLHSGGSPSATITNLSEEALYQSAKTALDKGNMDVAREGFQAFLKKYPTSKNADNAQFWIGEAYYREKWYEKAILEYQKVIESYPKGNKVPAAFLKQGFAFQNMGEKANARLILKELITKFPNSNEAKIAKDKIKVFN